MVKIFQLNSNWIDPVYMEILVRLILQLNWSVSDGSGNINASTLAAHISDAM